jgi:N-sulfoglucosamine sulfohydrolase
MIYAIPRVYIRRPEFELYDMRNAPYESRNLAGDPRYAKVLERYEDRLRAFQELTYDPWILKWVYQ